MIISSFFCFIIIISLFGYSYLYKKILNKSIKFQILNTDIFYGVLLITLFSLFINFFFPLKFYTTYSNFGLLFFLFGFKIKFFFSN